MRLIPVVLVVAGAVVSGCSGSKAAGDSGPQYACDKVQPSGFPTTAEGISVGDTLPDLPRTDMQGNPLCVRDYTGSVVLINIVAGWCVYCEQETPAIEEVYREQKDDGFVVLMYVSEDYQGGSPDPAFLQDWKDEFDITFPMIPDSGWNAYENWSLEVDTGYIYIPTSIILDRDGVVRYNASTALSKSSLETRIRPWMDADPTLDYE